MWIIPQILPRWRSSNKPPFLTDNKGALICPKPGWAGPRPLLWSWHWLTPFLPPQMALPCPWEMPSWHMPRSNSLGIHCGRPGLARGLWTHVAEGPHVEVHPLGKVGVREAGLPDVTQGLIGPETTQSWTLSTQASVRGLGAEVCCSPPGFAALLEKPLCRMKLKTPISGPHPISTDPLISSSQTLLPPGSPPASWVQSIIKSCSIQGW